jgi:hypothetical protein
VSRNEMKLFFEIFGSFLRQMMQFIFKNIVPEQQES